MKNLKVLFTLIALGFGYAGFAQDLTIINKTSCDFDYQLLQGYLNTGCTPSGAPINGTVSSNTSVVLVPSLDDFVHVVLAPNGCNTSLELIPYMSQDCSTCTAYPSLNTKGLVYCDQCGGLVTVYWEIDCQGFNVITIDN